MDKPLKSVTHGHCDARPTFTSPAAGHHRPLSCTKLYCLAIEAHVCEQLAQGCYLKAERLRFEPATFESQEQRCNHYAIRPQTNCNRTVNLSLTCNVTPIVALTRGRQVSIAPVVFLWGRGPGADVPAR